MEYVWVRSDTDDDFEIVFGARIIESLRNRYKIRDDYGKESYVASINVLRPMHPSCVKDVDDMILLGDLQEFSILRNLELRYMKNLIYTYTGNVLIAVNPYQSLPIYGPEVVKLYRGKKLGELPPHLFAVGDVSYDNMRVNGEKQCVIINGESGAGKTQSAKILLQYYATITGKHSEIEEQILESNPILEAFGNATTIRNNNSSRFGKYISINFNWEGKMKQAEIKQFLLEKSRVVMQSNGEKNYHVFYMLVNGLSQKEKDLLGLKDILCYKYLSEGSADEGKSKAERTEEFRAFRKALSILNFSNSLIWSIFELLAAILHFGNIVYNEITRNGVEAVEVWDSREISLISVLLSVPTQYIKACLSKRTIAIGSEQVLKDMNVQQAVDTRDGFAKAIYGNLFNFIVRKINEATNKEKVDGNAYIGVLDVFGFENYESNSFEQFCINLANEHLQQFFIRHTFKLEQRQYMDEGIAWKNIDFIDNKNVIMMLSTETMNLISIINDQSKFPNSTDETLLGKLIEHHGENENFLRPKYNNILVFGVKHFAGVVLYDIKDFLEKNRDSYSSDFLKLVTLSENQLLKTIFTEDVNNDMRYSRKKTQTTSATKFKNSLDALMSELNQCQPFFIRCIKPNDLKKPNLFNRKLCCQQLRYSGVWETSKIRQVGYSVRYSYSEFVCRYGVLKPGLMPANRLTQAELKSVASDICLTFLKSRVELQMGYSQIFLRNLEYLKLESEREKALSRHVIILQNAFRRWLYRKRFIALRSAAITIQKYWRGARNRKRYQFWRHGLLRLQSVIRTRYRIYSYQYIRHIIIRFQSRCRGFLIRRKFYREIERRRAINIRPSHIDDREEFDRKPQGQKYKASNQHQAKNKAFAKLLIEQDSYVHGRARTRYHEASKLVDDSFHFLNDHASPRKRNSDYYEKL
ncbi:UNVERIFIED_CONTAM: hypothetical protein PYX00_006447 [Menopon gallinae]|uniref:Myosin motor domain-containing protein n=1 Tax=Menopon gallinae TaxID=328185 RepID=A0AAW2HV86_9NEOP